jgi:hypothetical protein
VDRVWLLSRTSTRTDWKMTRPMKNTFMQGLSDYCGFWQGSYSWRNVIYIRGIIHQQRYWKGVITVCSTKHKHFMGKTALCECGHLWAPPSPPLLVVHIFWTSNKHIVLLSADSAVFPHTLNYFQLHSQNYKVQGATVCWNVNVPDLTLGKWHVLLFCYS